MSQPLSARDPGRAWAPSSVLLWGLLLVLGLPGPARGQQAAPPGGGVRGLDPAKAFTQYIHDAWQTEDGLPQNTVRAILQARNGYLWLGTQEGLVRFDGLRFTTFDRRNTSALASNEIIALLEDAAGALWIGTYGGGVTRYADGRFHTYTREDGLPSNEVYAIHEDARGGLWFGTLGGGLARFEDGAFRSYTAEDGLASDIVLALAGDAQGRLWIGMDGGLSLLEDGRFTSFGVQHGLPGSVVRAVHVDRAGSVWVGTENGLARYRDGRFTAYTTRDGLSDNIITTLYEDRQGILWAGTLAGGLCRLQQGRFSCYTSEQGLTHENVRALHEDREGSLWIGTDGGGLNRLRNGKFTPFTRSEGLSHDVVYSVYEDRSGALWIGTEGGGVNRLADGRVTVYGPREGLSSGVVLSITQTRDGSVWIGTEGGGLNRIRDGRITRYTTADGLPGDMIRALFEDAEGVLWIGTENGLGRYRDGRFTTYTTEDGLPHPIISALTDDGAGGLWIGTFGGLARMRGTTFTPYTTADGLSSDMILALHRDAEGVLWIATHGGGLSRFRDGAFVSYTTKDGLHSDVVVQVVEDADGHLWMGSNRGIFRLPKRQLADFDEGRVRTLTPTVYGRSDGLESIECNGGMQPAAWRSRDGRLWFSTLQGVAMVDPAKLRDNPVPPPVVIERFLVGGEEVAPGAARRLPPGSDDFEFHYTALSFSSPQEVRFRYRLEGQDQGWHAVTERRAAYYTNLPPGTYTFRVVAANEDGVWNDTGAALSFYVAPFFYQTAWFLGACVLGLVLLGAGAYNLRMRQLRARERHLRRLVDERTRDLSEEKRRVEQAKSVIEVQAVELKALNERLEERVREQLDTILRSKRLTKYFPRKLVNQILSADTEVDLTSERRLVTVFFSDLIGFTELSERVDPDEVTALLNEYLNSMVGLIERYGGTLDKFMGDGIMAFFGAPDEMEAAEQAHRAVAMAAAMQREAAVLAERWQAKGLQYPLQVRMGVHQTRATVGNFGSRELMEYTVIGRGVNFAKRLESACTPGHVMVSAEVQGLTAEAFPYGPPRELTFKGIAAPARVWELDPTQVTAEPPLSALSSGARR